ncbi:MAG: metal-dependent hydrolase [Gammaproteobacteria bacterium]|nr:metal-dependent hydrolase [Gammaproteobacteria bacterium]MBK81730.1 metal-dependent hydrolase [Gammaproteobacteria bacterium]|tara:strand:- start:657 stop:1385 length:729 start_codon:yes stop_codon:yes gene_type:complete
MSKSSFVYGDEHFEYEVCFTPDRGQKIAIHVRPDASVQVDAPDGEPAQKIHSTVLKRARWIRNHVLQARAQRAHVLPRGYVSGESHFYLGRRYQLKVSDANGAGPHVKLWRGRIQVESEKRAPEEIRKHLYRWYRQRASGVFGRRLHAIASNVPWLKEVPPLRLLKMRRQWGSCSPQGVVFLNPHLVKAPRDCVDYVITHELCHLKEHNHSRRYYRLLREIMPGWEPVKARLDGMAELLLNE